MHTNRDPKTGKRVLKFIATSAVIVSPLAVAACGGSGNKPETPEHTNVAEEADEATNVAPAGINVDHTADEHTNVAEEEVDETDEVDEHTNVTEESDPE